MKSNIKRVFALFTALFGLMYCNPAEAADIKLEIPDFTVDNYTPVEVNIMLDNEVPVISYSFNIEMPEGLEIVQGSAEKTLRFTQGQTFGFRNNTFAVVSMQDAPFSGNSGSVGTFKVKVAPGYVLPEKEQKVAIVMKNISIVGLDFSNNVSVKEQNVNVTLVDNSDPVNLTLSSNPAEFTINPAGSQTISVALENDKAVQGLQMEIVLPEGFTYKMNGTNIFDQTSRMSGGATIMPKTTGNLTRLVIADMINNEILSAGSGEFMSFTIVAPEDFQAETAVLKIQNVQASVSNRTYKPEALDIEITNGVIAYNKANDEISSLQTSLDNALAEIAENAEHVKDLFTGADIQTSIDELKNAVEEAYDDLTLTGNYDTVMAPAEGINEAIGQLLVEATQAEKDYKDTLARNEALEKAETEIKALRDKLEETLETIATDCPDVKDKFDGAAIASAIDALETSVKNAFEDKTLVEDYDNIMAPVASIEEMMASLIEEAKEAQNASEADAALKAAKEKADNEISSLNSNLSEALETIATDCPDVAEQFPGSDIKAQIKTLSEAVAKAYEDKTLAADYDEVMTPVESIESAIANLKEDAKAAQKKHDEEQAAAEAARQEAYNNAKAIVALLQAQLETALNTIATECTDVKDYFKGENVSASINDLQKAIDAAFADNTIVEKYDELIAPRADIETAIGKLVSDAKEAQKAYDKNAALEKAYLNAKSELAALDQALATALATIETECPDVKGQFPGTGIQQQITVLRNAVNSAYENGSLATDYDKVMAPSESIKAAIEKLIEDAKAAQKKYEDSEAAEKALMDAYKKANSRIDELKKELASTLETIAETCPDVADLFPGTSIEKEISNLKEAAKDAFDMKTLADDYDEVMAPAEDIETAIAKLLSDAQAAQKKYEEDKAAEEALNKAYNDATERIDELKKELASTLETIAETCPDVADQFSGKDIEKVISELEKSVEDSYESKALTEDYDEVMAPAEDIETTISDLLAAAQAEQKAFDDAKEAEESRQAANKAAYEADLAEIAKLQEELDNAKADIEIEYPGYDFSEDYAAIEAELTRMKDQAENEYEKVADEGEYSNDVNSDKIEEMIKQMIENAKQNSGVITILGEDVSSEDRIFSIDGKPLAKPITGVPSIIVKADGRVMKVVIK